MAKIKIVEAPCRQPLVGFGDIVLADERVYLVSVAPGTGGLSGGKALFTNLATGDIRSRVPVDLDEVTMEKLKELLKAENVVPLRDATVTITME